MKIVIFAGGLGTRLSEETHLRPKPMVEIGGKPILWHIMKIYAEQGFNDFVICLGYKGYMIKEYFINYFYHNSNLTVDLENNNITVHNSHSENFKVTLVDTGLHTKTAGRLKRVEKYIDTDNFMLTYGDGLANVNIKSLIEFHLNHDKMATVTSVQPEGRFGGMEFGENNIITSFKEKPKGDGHWINGGFFVLKKDVFSILKEDSDSVMWEEYPMNTLTEKSELVSFKHHGFWRCMDALRDKVILEELWENKQAPWKIW